MCPQHRFGLMTLRERATLHADSLTYGADAMVARLGALQPAAARFASFDLTSLLEEAASVQVSSPVPPPGA